MSYQIGGSTFLWKQKAIDQQSSENPNSTAGERIKAVPQVNDPPHVGPEPHGGARVGLVLPDENGVGDRQEAHERAVLQELKDF